MTATRSKKEIKNYRQHQKHVEKPQDMCAFCEINKSSPQLVKLAKHFKIVQNIFPYSHWDSQTVDDHLVVVPNQHTDTLSDLSAPAAQEFVQIISEYESNGYSVWARPPGAITKSLQHQHTHLIKLSGKSVRFLLYLRRPYFRFLLK